MQDCKLLLFDLDGTLLRSDKTISAKTQKMLQRCKQEGILIGVSTSRAEQNALSLIEIVQPDIIVSSGGALVKYNGRCIYKAMFSKDRLSVLSVSDRLVLSKRLRKEFGCSYKQIARIVHLDVKYLDGLL